MSYLHSIGAVMLADDIARRRKKVLSKLQQELYDLMVAELVDGDLAEYVPGLEDMETFLEGLKKDISGMDAVDLRRNIRIWKEDISFGYTAKRVWEK